METTCKRCNLQKPTYTLNTKTFCHSCHLEYKNYLTSTDEYNQAIELNLIPSFPKPEFDEVRITYCIDYFEDSNCPRCNKIGNIHLFMGEYLCFSCQREYTNYLVDLDKYYINLRYVLDYCSEKNLSIIDTDFMMTSLVKPVFKNSLN